jgi:hypothetical protein
LRVAPEAAVAVRASIAAAMDRRAVRVCDMSSPPCIPGFAVRPGWQCDKRMDGEISTLL